ncbi:MAG TPA: diguanylate cyclase [Casimicrobiaceae bacterium]|nr:diguanylate cyclase [Casimicrobiaceae bacterium]
MGGSTGSPLAEGPAGAAAAAGAAASAARTGELAAVGDAGGEPSRPAATDRRRELAFVETAHRMRTLGLAVGFVCVASVLRLHRQSPGWWALLFADGFIWPHAAWLLARRSPEPRRAEFRNLLVDSALGGVWIAVMRFNPLASVLLATMLSVDKILSGGRALLLPASVVLVVACALTSAALGFPVDLATPLSVVVGSMPLLIVFPIAISSVTYMLASELARANRRLDTLGRTDELTGLANRRQGFALGEVELERSRRSGRPAVLVVLDIDHFKHINDRHGHPAGDAVLRAIARVLRESCRSTDVVARYGGDEFLLVLPDLRLPAVEVIADRIRHRLDAMIVEGAPGARCTVSLGAAEAMADMADVEDWIQQADAALYRAKAAGRDRFIGTAIPAP